ncbi:MAG: efflux RND transporter periplasmic adaptor subunit [Bacteroidota bacterium]|nr:efflux RND transporter periplasmic adaptor subunit [Bacteroidota bacterium]
MKNILIYIYKFSIIILLFVLTACSAKEEKKNASSKDTCAADQKTISLTKEQFENSEIETGIIETKNLNGILKVNGKLDVPPQNLISVSAPIGGFLKSTGMLEGMHVIKGQVIAVIEHPDIVQLQQDFVEAKSKFDFLEQEYKRQQLLSKENVNSTKVMQQTQSDYNISQAKYKALEEKIRMAGIDKNNILSGNISGTISVRSPINGYITKINVNIGRMVNQQDIMFEIVDTEHLHAELTVFEKDITKIKPGQKVRFTLANDPDKELTATVHLIGRLFDDSRSVRIHCHLDKEDKELLPGMFINAIVELNGGNVNCVPVNAIVKENDKEYIFIKEVKMNCGKHELCTGHEECPLEEDCPEHAECEAHEKCKDKKNCKHKECTAHENCSKQTEAGGFKFTIIEVKTGITDGKYIEIKALKEVAEDAEIVTSGAFFILSQIKMSGTIGACCQ